MRVPNEHLIARFQLSRMPNEAADVTPLVAANRSLYERARDLGGTRLTTSALPFSHADWRAHFGPEWDGFKKAKERFDPRKVLASARGLAGD